MSLDMDANQILEHIQINNMILAAAGDGVASGLGVSERGAGVNMSVDVATGSALINGTTYTESSIVNLVIEAAHATLHRKDLITYDPTTSNPVVTKGTDHAGGTGDPIFPPDIPAGDILLAIVEVTAAATTITNGEVMDCIVEITKLDELGIPSDNTTLNASTAVHGLLKKLSNVPTQFLNGQGNWATPAGSGDMTKAVYDTDDSGVVDDAEKVDGKTVGNATGNVPISNGAICTNLKSANSDKLDGRIPGNGTGNVPISNQVKCVGLNADEVDGCDAGTAQGNVYKIHTGGYYSIYYHGSGTGVIQLAAGTNGYQLTTHSAGGGPTWAAASDLIFSDTHCPKCGQEFNDGDDLILHLIGHNEVGDILTIPMHLSCANAPKKTVTIKRKVFEDRYILDEETCEPVIQRVQKTTETTVTRHKLKEGCGIEKTTGRAYTVGDKDRRTEIALADATEETEETITEPVYEDVEYRL